MYVYIWTLWNIFQARVARIQQIEKDMLRIRQSQPAEAQVRSNYMHFPSVVEVNGRLFSA